MVNPKFVPDIAPPTVRLRESTVRILDAFIVTAPVPKFRSPEPMKVKSPFQFCGFVDRDLRPPLVLSIAPPLMLNVLEEIAPLLLMAKVPALRVVAPV